jgi:hypothetical protein
MPEIVLQNELKRLEKFDENLKWFQEHYAELKKQYKGEFVAVNLVNDVNQPIDHDKDYEALINRLKKKNGDISFFVVEQVYEQPVAYLV